MEKKEKDRAAIRTREGANCDRNKLLKILVQR